VNTVMKCGFHKMWRILSAEDLLASQGFFPRDLYRTAEDKCPALDAAVNVILGTRPNVQSTNTSTNLLRKTRA
jgi:hypothetical protein